MSFVSLSPDLAIRFYLRKAERMASYALEHITPEEEYLRDELEQHVRSVRTLLDKMSEEEHLRRDRDALLSDVSADPDQGLNAWISGKTTA